jgi:hypothetical protein
MRDRLGLALTETAASAVLVRGDVVEWSQLLPVANDESRCGTVRELHAASPRRGRPTLSAVVGPTFVQVRRLEGLPQLDQALLSQLVRHNASTFFLKRDGGVVTSDVHCDGEGTWAAAFDRDVVDEIVALATELKLRLLGIAPGDPTGGTGGIDTDAERARRAADVGRATRLVWRSGVAMPRRRRIRQFVGIGLLIAVAATAFVAPIIRSVVDERRMAREIAALRPLELEAAQTSAELRRVTQLLAQRTDFDAKHGRMLRLVSGIAAVLPESTAIVSIRAESLDVSLVALGPRVTELLPALTAVADPKSLRVVGSVSHDLQSGVHLERAAFRFRRQSNGDVR